MGSPSSMGRRTTRSAGPLLLAVALLCTACNSKEAALAPPRALTQATTVVTPAQVSGVTGEGALYAMYVPSNWNGSLVLWAHGYNSPSDPLTLFYSHFEGIRTGLLDGGYAVALSSYSENGWAVVDGAARTHQLVGLFTARFQRPARVYLIGRSMGSLVATKLAETHPAQYDGIVAYCAFLGGAQMFVDHVFNTRLLFDLYYPGVLPGDPLDPPPVNPGTMLALAQAAMVADASKMHSIATAMAAIGMPLTAVPGSSYNTTLMGSILTALGYAINGYSELAMRGHGQIPFDNWDTDYVIPAVEAGIPRYHGNPDAMNFMQQAYQPSGRLRIPMVALDIMWDNVTPLFHKDAYQVLVDAEGASDLLFRTAVVPEYRHCPSTSAPVLNAFQLLVDWVENGVHP